MHEMSLCRSLFRIIEQNANDYNCQQVNSITLVIGELSSVDIEALKFAFTICQKQQSLTYNATLYIKAIEPWSHCRQCDHEFRPDSRFSPCPQCATLNVELLQGDEFSIQSMEAE